MSHRRKSARPTNKHWRNGPHTFDHSPTQSACEDEGEDRSPPAADPGQAIEIPSDIFKDFQQLKHATNLDTTTLMRNLLNDYHRLPARSSWHRPLVEEEEQKSPPPTVVDDKQVMRDSSERGMFDMDMNRSSPLVDSGFIDHGCDSPFGTGTDQPLDLSVVVKSERSTPESVIGPQDKKTLVGQLQRKLIGGDRSPASPTVSSAPCVMMTSDVIMSHVSGQGGLVMTSAMPNQCRVVMSSAVPSSGTFTLSGDKNECNIMMPVQMSMQLPTVTNVDGGQGVMTSNINVETSSGQQIVAIPFLQTVPAVQVQAAPKPQPQPQPQPQQQLQQFQLQQQQQPQQPQPQPHVPARRGRKPGSVNKGNKASKPVRSNEMKVVAENTMFPGVYTSILKLPWSRRSRSKAHPPAPPVPPPTQPSMTLLPVTSSQDIATSESTLATSASHSPSTTQSVMMVYPNATISALGKPVRKRGRPPKLPVLSHLLAEKKPKKDSPYTPVATTLPSQSASISADGSMLSILSTHSIGADTSTEDDKLKKLQTVSESQDSKTFQLNTPDQFPAPTTQHLETPDQGTATTKGSNGAMFQEMLLSSKSLINIKPRKRQSSNLIKSGENFICTSFRIRPRGSRHKAPTDSPKAGLPQVPPEPVPASPASTDINHASPVPQTEPLERVTVSPTSTVDDSPLSKNMFHELYHCKVCNEIVPADEKQTHKQQHVPVKFFCLTCGLEYYSFLQGKAGEDPDAPQSFQCERCSENYNSNLPLSSGLHLKTESLQCDLCDEQLKSFSDLCEHRREIHGDEKRGIDNYRCDECGKVFFTEKSLDAHRETHEKEEEYCEEEMNPEELELAKEFSSKKEYTCVYDGCKKKFMKKFHLQEHIRVKHFNIRAYRCSWPGCYKEFAAERHLKVHLLIHKDEKPLKCDFCDYRCRQRNAMNWHMRKHPEAPYRYRKFGMLSGGDD